MGKRKKRTDASYESKEGTEKRVCPEELSQQDDDTSQPDDPFACNLCSQSWTSDGPHRIVSLSCGHVFGKTCITSHLQDTMTCPSCDQMVVDVSNLSADSEDLDRGYTSAQMTTPPKLMLIRSLEPKPVEEKDRLIAELEERLSQAQDENKELRDKCQRLELELKLKGKIVVKIESPDHPPCLLKVLTNSPIFWLKKSFAKKTVRFPAD